ncbi:hypothetical protein MTO96_006286 [Rhipicephalus appendiculatus]
MDAPQEAFSEGRVMTRAEPVVPYSPPCTRSQAHRFSAQCRAFPELPKRRMSVSRKKASQGSEPMPGMSSKHAGALQPREELRNYSAGDYGDAM